MQNALFYKSPLIDLEITYPGSAKRLVYSNAFDLKNGDVIMITGASGSGKSTFLKILKGIIPRLINANLCGEIFFKGTEISKVDDRELLKVGYLAQNPFDQMICDSVYNELAFGLENLGKSADEIKEKIDEILSRVKLSHLINRKTSELSGGEAQLINLLGILLVEPEVLLLDEPTAFLDTDSAECLVEMLYGKTLVVAEHNVKFFQKIITKTISLDSPNYFSSFRLEPRLNSGKNDSRMVGLEKILEIAGLSISFGEKNILDDVDLVIHKGEIVGLKGGVGSGKSTLLKLILGMYPSHDEIIFRNESIDTLKKVFERIGIVWQNSDLHFFCESVEQESNLLNDFGLCHLCKQNPYTLSEGEKRRLALATVMESGVELVLLDEPTFGQDDINVSLIENKIFDMNRLGKSFLIVSHDEDFLSRICDTIYCLTQGKILKC